MHPLGEGGPLVEWMDAAVVDGDHAVLTGHGGWAVASLETGETTHFQNAGRGYRIDCDPDTGLVIIGRRDSGLVLADVSDPTAGIDLARKTPLEGFHEDVSIHGGIIMVGWQDEGVLFLDDGLDLLSTVESDHAFAVGIEGDRAVYTELDDLVLLDVSTVEEPVELDRVTTTGEGRDIDFHGDQLALAMGGRGAAWYTVDNDVLVHQGDVTVPGSVFSVALDEDRMWLGAWEVTAVAALLETGPVIIGHEMPQRSAMGLAATGGRAMVADWTAQTALLGHDDVAGPELVLSERISIPDNGDGRAVRIENNGYYDLELTIDEATDGWEWDSGEYLIAPGGAAQIVITPPSGDWEDHSLTFTSNDPDESEGSVSLEKADQSLGQPHEAFDLPGFTWPEGDLETYSFDPDDNDQIIFLAYFALY
jgi:hypothetical protein